MSQHQFGSRKTIKDTGIDDAQRMRRGLRGKTPVSTGKLRMVVVHDSVVRRAWVEVKRHIKRRQRFPQRCHPRIVEIDQIVWGLDLGIAVHHDPFEAEFSNAALKLAYCLFGILERKGGHANVTAGVCAHLFCEKVVHYASSALCFDRVEDALHAEGAKPGTEGEQYLVNARLIHGLEARRVEV